MTHCRAAVLLATYNGEAFLGEFLESLVRQTCDDFTLFVRDDGSTDRTLSIVGDFSERLSISVVKSGSRLGPALSFFELLGAAGDGFDSYLFADQDDYWVPAKIERAVERLGSLGSLPSLYCSRLEYVDSTLRHLKFSRKPRVLALENALVENVVTGCTMAINDSARRLLLSAPPTGMLMHDWWFYLVIVSLGSVVYDDFPAIKYRQHSGNVVGAATTVLGGAQRRLQRFFSYRERGGYRISDQAKAFRNSFGSMLRAEQAELVDMLAGPKSLANRLRLALQSPLARQTLFDNLLLRLVFLAGRY